MGERTENIETVALLKSVTEDSAGTLGRFAT